MSSIALTCLNLVPLAKQVKQLFGEDQHKDREHHIVVPQWLDEILTNGYPNQNISNTLEMILLENAFVNCTIPYDGSDETIECTMVNFLNY